MFTCWDIFFAAYTVNYAQCHRLGAAAVFKAHISCLCCTFWTFLLSDFTTVPPWCVLFTDVDDYWSVDLQSAVLCWTLCCVWFVAHGVSPGVLGDQGVGEARALAAWPGAGVWRPLAWPAAGASRHPQWPRDALRGYRQTGLWTVSGTQSFSSFKCSEEVCG